MAKATPRKGMQLFDADEALMGMITGARGGTIDKRRNKPDSASGKEKTPSPRFANVFPFHMG